MSGQTIALSLFLVLLAFGIIILLGIFIVIKRSIARRKSRIGRVAYTNVGNGAPKFWKELINAKINATVKVRSEPRVFGNLKPNQQSDTADRNLGFQFRAKTVDLFADLRDKIVASYPHLEAPPFRGINDFLITSSTVAMSPKPEKEIIETYCRLYNRARFDPGAYTDVDYLSFLEIHDQLLQSVVVKSASQSIDSPSKSSRSLHRRRKTVSPPRASAPAEFIELSAGRSGSNVNTDTNTVEGLRSPISRSGSAASDDSQTALIRLDDNHVLRQ